MIIVIPPDCIQFGEQLQIFELVGNLDMILIKSWRGNVNDTKRLHRKWISSLKRYNSTGTNSQTNSKNYVHLIKFTLPSFELSTCLTYPMDDKAPLGYGLCQPFHGSNKA